MKSLFPTGTRVTVSDRETTGHMRTPTYIRGKTGLIERRCGSFRNPATLAYGGDGMPEQPLYRVRFFQHEIWTNYLGPPQDTVDIEIYQHWLERAA